jgi:hypothetical protein
MDAATRVVPKLQQHCVVYRKSDGQILHRHFVVILPGAKDVEKKEVEERALRIVESKGHNVQHLGVLHVDFSAIKHNEKYKVDVQKQELVSEGKIVMKTGQVSKSG